MHCYHFTCMCVLKISINSIHVQIAICIVLSLPPIVANDLVLDLLDSLHLLVVVVVVVVTSCVHDDVSMWEIIKWLKNSTHISSPLKYPMMAG